jgi:hypothetical protein
VIEVHFAILNEIHWIGVDLNTTGHVAVAADPIVEKLSNWEKAFIMFTVMQLITAQNSGKKVNSGN